MQLVIFSVTSVFFFLSVNIAASVKHSTLLICIEQQHQQHQHYTKSETFPFRSGFFMMVEGNRLYMERSSNPRLLKNNCLQRTKQRERCQDTKLNLTCGWTQNSNHRDECTFTRLAIGGLRLRQRYWTIEPKYLSSHHTTLDS